MVGRHCCRSQNCDCFGGCLWDNHGRWHANPCGVDVRGVGDIVDRSSKCVDVGKKTFFSVLMLTQSSLGVSCVLALS